MMRAMDLCSVSHLKVCCVSTKNPGLMVEFVSEKDAPKPYRREYCDPHLQMLSDFLSLPPQHLLGEQPRLTLELRMALDVPKVLSCEMKIQAKWFAWCNSESESVECPCSMEKLDTLLRRYGVVKVSSLLSVEVSMISR
ncbi:hypothetical protein BT93_C0984 [Corymbia citriodora subsp. variegata]|nr:hypothetical protein BT93_C0984 [Corymbia citriodora subsp. variegata]